LSCVFVFSCDHSQASAARHRVHWMRTLRHQGKETRTVDRRTLGPGLLSVSRQSAQTGDLSHQLIVRLSLLPTRPAVNFPTAKHYSILAGVIMPLHDRGTCVWTTCPELLYESEAAESQTRDFSIESPTPWPLHHHSIMVKTRKRNKSTFAVCLMIFGDLYEYLHTIEIYHNALHKVW